MLLIDSSINISKKLSLKSFEICQSLLFGSKRQNKAVHVMSPACAVTTSPINLNKETQTEDWPRSKENISNVLVMHFARQIKILNKNTHMLVLSEGNNSFSKANLKDYK